MIKVRQAYKNERKQKYRYISEFGSELFALGCQTYHLHDVGFTLHYSAADNELRASDSAVLTVLDVDSRSPKPRIEILGLQAACDVGRIALCQCGFYPRVIAGAAQQRYLMLLHDALHLRHDFLEQNYRGRINLCESNSVSFLSGAPPPPPSRDAQTLAWNLPSY